MHSHEIADLWSSAKTAMCITANELRRQQKTTETSQSESTPFP
jgi:hypothetical protein